jgi:hypothetical protein
MELLNKDLELIKLGKNKVVVVKRIKQPVYYIGGKEFTEYDIRNLQLEVSRGNISNVTANEMKVTDEAGNVLNFREDGVLTNNAKGFDIISKMVLEMIGKQTKK